MRIFFYLFINWFIYLFIYLFVYLDSWWKRWWFVVICRFVCFAFSFHLLSYWKVDNYYFSYYCYVNAFVMWCKNNYSIDGLHIRFTLHLFFLSTHIHLSITHICRSNLIFLTYWSTHVYFSVTEMGEKKK